jgi:hypothetical protein
MVPLLEAIPKGELAHVLSGTGDWSTATTHKFFLGVDTLFTSQWEACSPLRFKMT